MKSWAWAAVGILVTFGAMGAPACGSGSAANGGGGSGGGGTGTVAPVGSGGSKSTMSTSTTMDCGSLPATAGQQLGAACDTCLTGMCCAQAKACDTTTDCFTLLQCEGACTSGDTKCVATCEAQTPGGKAPLAAFNNCFGMQCSTQCGGGTSTVVCDSMIDVGDATCATCLTSKCCTTWEAVGKEGSEGIADLNSCGGDPTCMNDKAAKAAFQCEETNCSAGKTPSCGTPICGSGLSIGPATCADCLGMGTATTGCCGATTECAKDPTCLNCITMSPLPAGCSTNALYKAANKCQNVTCATECGGKGAGGGGQGGSGGTTPGTGGTSPGTGGTTPGTGGTTPTTPPH